jgi:hypothetical protein
MITNSEWQDWKLHRVTRQVLKILEEKVEEGKQHWANGGFVGATAEQTAIVNAMAVGKTQALQAIINMDYETFVSEMDDGPTGNIQLDSTVSYGDGT